MDLPSRFLAKKESLLCFELQLVFNQVHHFLDCQDGFRLLHLDGGFLLTTFQLQSIDAQQALHVSLLFENQPPTVPTQTGCLFWCLTHHSLEGRFETRRIRDVDGEHNFSGWLFPVFLLLLVKNPLSEFPRQFRSKCLTQTLGGQSVLQFTSQGFEIGLERIPLPQVTVILALEEFNILRDRL